MCYEVKEMIEGLLIGILLVVAMLMLVAHDNSTVRVKKAEDWQRYHPIWKDKFKK